MGGRRLFTAYVWGKPWLTLRRSGRTAEGGKFPSQISRRKDQAGSLGTEEKISLRAGKRDQSKPWVFWHRYWSSKENRFKEGPYGDRKKLMKILCKRAGVQYFRFHPIRHAGASIMDNEKVPIGSIQKILGHENRKTTEIYLHTVGDSEREAMARFEKARKKSHTNSHTEKEGQKKRVRRGHLTLLKH